MLGRVHRLWVLALTVALGVVVAGATTARQEAAPVRQAAPARQAPPLRQAAAPVRQAPRLVVLLVVDQLRADYLEQYGSQWTSGLRRLMSDGAWFRAAAYAHMATVTCVGHSNVVSGTLPATHGIVGNSWWDRAAGRSAGCVADAGEKLVVYGGGATEAVAGTSARNLMAPALPDEMRLQLPVAPRIVTLSLKDYTATMLAGRRAEAATWFHAGSGGWATSTAFAKEPVPFLAAFIAANPVSGALDEVWRKLLPDAAYRHEDDGVGEKGAPQWTTRFPHPLKGASGKADAAFYEAWQSSPYSDAYLGKMAEAAVDALKLGQGQGTDYLAVSFSALDLVGHDFGPRSHEVQDLLARLDLTVGSLIDHLDRRVGRGRYVLALTSDHGVAPIPEQARAAGLAGGRLSAAELIDRIDKALEPALGPGTHVARVNYGDVCFRPGVWEKIRGNADAVRAAMDAARTMPGIARVMRGDELEHGVRSPDRLERAAALNYFPGRSGDLIVIPQPYYFFGSGATGTTHGSPYDYDQRVPVFLLGQGIRKGQYLAPAAPIDIAPTLAWLCGVTMASAEGRVLMEAMVEAASGY